MNVSSLHLSIRYSLCLFIMLVCVDVPLLKAQQKEDDNIELYNSEETYEYQYNSKQKQVTVDQLIEKTFICNAFRSSIPFGETYNNQEEILDVNIEVDGKRARDIRPTYDYLNINSYFYTDARMCYFELPFVQKGSKSKVTIEKEIKDPRYLSTVFFTDNYPTRTKKITVIVPRWMQADIHPYNFEGQNISVQKTFDSKKNADIYTYTATNMPAMKKTVMSPGPTWLWPHIMICSKTADYEGNKSAYFATTADLYKWYHSLTLQLHSDTVALDERAKKITEGITDKWEQLKAIFYWVEDNVRYIAFEDGIAGFKPDEAHEVMRKKYGDCKGMANLTKALLQRCGFDARLCWIGTNHIMYDYSIPSLSVDNHMICAVNYKGKWWFLDATEEYMQPGVYAERIQGRQVMIENGDNYLLEHIPGTKPEQNSRLFKEELYVDGNNMAGKILYKYEGESKTDILSSINSVKKDRLQTALENYITNSNMHYKISNMKTTSLEQRDGNLEVNFDLVYQDAVSSFGSEMYIDIDYNKEFNNAVIDTVKRKIDLRFDCKDNFITETDLLMPAGYKAGALPENLHIVHPKFTIDITYAVKDNKIYYRKKITILNTYLQRSDFLEWNKAIASLSKKYLEQITLVKL
ncbi:Transglutaminase-like enzyme, putative cysteine protease [Chitinophaga sp. YR573]|uniref:transglutaminase domain-containing protein n=1 Tax=Chitinophaga sp. YR573 TaxID=1881040 RepID=UPI0008AAFA4F|nr:transglutaminase domain-containing protein [Chitinophaga sp. YR573]SEW35406.1 Transglutaminase-like enzyme, putative cysteine protease [Chitinophaga sp. YR573]